MRALHVATAAAFVAMSAGFVWWNWQAFADPGALLLVAPLVLASLFVFRRSVRPLVVAGALALPYLCLAIVEIIAANAARTAPIVAVACGVVFMALLGPATRNAKRAALARAKESS
jgi:hypothetical protein